jgi:hypothetical protein
MNDKVIIFCQAPADLIYILDIINKYPSLHIVVYVMNVKSLYYFLIRLHLKNVELHFLPPIKLRKTIFSIIQAKYHIKYIWNKYFSTNKNSDVYFFSTSYDYCTATLVKRLSINPTNTIFYYNHYDNLTSASGKQSFSINRFLQNYVYRYITGGTHFIHNITINFPKFDYKHYPIQEVNIVEKPVVNENYLYRGLNLPIKKNILFFLSPDDIDILIKESSQKVIDLINLLTDNNYCTVLKGHPRIGEPDLIKNIVHKTIPAYIPGEFIDYSYFDYIIGVFSTALCYPAQKWKVISLIDMLEFNDNTFRIKCKEYIQAYSGNKICMPKAYIFLNEEIIWQ